MPLARTSRPAFTLIEVLVACAVAVVLFSLALSAVQKARGASAAARCQNNLRQIGLGLHQHHDGAGALPPGVSWDGGRAPYPHMSWLTRLLPQVGDTPLWMASVSAYKQNPFFESPPHYPVLGHVVPLYACPADGRCATPRTFGAFQTGFTSYLGVEGVDQHSRDGLLFADSAVRFADVRDGLSNTLLVGERPPSADMTMGWWYAGWGQDKDGSCEMLLGAREVLTSALYADCPSENNRFGPGRADARCDFLHFWSPHNGGAHFLLGDGSVRFLRYSANDILPALATWAGGETVTVPE